MFKGGASKANNQTVLLEVKPEKMGLQLSL